MGSKGWGFVPTSFAKSHLLEMRREGLVKDASWNHQAVLAYAGRAYGPEKLANWYCVTMKGMILLKELYPDDKRPNILMSEFFDKVFEGGNKVWIEFRLRGKYVN